MNETMKHFACNPMRLLAGACGLFTLLAVTPAVVAQQSAAAHTDKNPIAVQATSASAATSAARPVADEETAAPNSARSQGIKVHGHWVLQVKNADGTLGERREFDNSLVTGATLATPTGNQALALLISGNAVVGDPAIAFIPSGVAITDPTVPCANGTVSQCFGFTTTQSPVINGLNMVGQMAGNIAATNPLTASQTGLNITVSVSPNINWTLSGNYAVPSGLTSVAYVETILPLCVNGTNVRVNGFTDLALANPQVVGSGANRGATSAPSACDNTVGNVIYGTLTETAVTTGSVATPLTVTTGQIIAITVIITFS